MVCKKWSRWTKVLSPQNSSEPRLSEETTQGTSFYCRQHRTCFTQKRAVEHPFGFNVWLHPPGQCQAVRCTTCLVLSVLLNWWTIISLSYACFFKIAFSGRLNLRTNTPFDTVLQRLSESLHLPATIKSVQPPCRRSSSIKQGGFLFQYQPANSMLIRSANNGAYTHSLVLTWLKLQCIKEHTPSRCEGQGKAT